MSKFFVALFVVALFGCGGAGNTSGDKIGAQSYTEVDSGTLVKSGSTISGTGSIVFLNPLSAVSSNHNFQTTFSLEDSGSLTLVTFSGNRLDGGTSIKFLRQGAVLKVALLNGGTEHDMSAKFTDFDASKSLSFFADIHNVESPTHILIWSGSTSDFGEDAAILNTENDGGSSGNGSGTFWGFILHQASLTQAEVGAPKFVEE
jgi:hypothetical protein